MEIARDLFTVFSALPARFQQIQYGIPGRQRGRRHLGVRQSEDKSNGTRGRVWMQVETRKNPPPRRMGFSDEVSPPVLWWFQGEGVKAGCHLSGADRNAPLAYL